MKITHIMADGSTWDSVEGVVIQSEQFYQVLRGILEKQNTKINTYKEGNTYEKIS